MKYTIAGIELHYLVREWTEALIDARVDKIFMQDDLISLKLYKTGKGTLYLHYRLPSNIYLSSEKLIETIELPHFAAYLRKNLSNARVREIRQLSKRERIVEIVLEKDKVYRLIIELLPPGNVILCDADYLILSPLKPKKFSNRIVRARAPYEMQIREDVTETMFIEAMAASEKNLVKTLAMDIGLSGIYAEELCIEVEMDKDRSPKELSAEECRHLYKAYLALFEKSIDPHSDEKHVYPFALKSKETSIAELQKSYNESLGAFFLLHKEEKTDPRLDAKKAIIQQQEETILKLEADAIVDQRKGELIYEHYTQINDLLQQCKKDPKEAEGRYAFMKKYSNKERTIEIELGEDSES